MTKEQFEAHIDFIRAGKPTEAIVSHRALRAEFERIHSEWDQTQVQFAEALKCPQESWECAKKIRTLTKEREALRTWNQQLIASEALARTQLALAQGALEVFSNRLKLAYSLREESPHLYAFVEAIGCEMVPYLARLDAKEKE